MDILADNTIAQDNPLAMLRDSEQEWLCRFRRCQASERPLPRQYQLDYQIEHYYNRLVLGMGE